MVSDTVIASFPNPVIPFDPYAVSNLASVPVTDVMVAVLTVPVVLPSKVFNAVTSARLLSVVTTISFPNPVISLDPAAYTMFASATVPVI